jgi:hypothetical protein
MYGSYEGHGLTLQNTMHGDYVLLLFIDGADSPLSSALDGGSDYLPITVDGISQYTGGFVFTVVIAPNGRKGGKLAVHVYLHSFDYFIIVI